MKTPDLFSQTAPKAPASNKPRKAKRRGKFSKFASSPAEVARVEAIRKKIAF